MYMIFAG